MIILSLEVVSRDLRLLNLFKLTLKNTCHDSKSHEINCNKLFSNDLIGKEIRLCKFYIINPFKKILLTLLSINKVNQCSGAKTYISKQMWLIYPS